MKKINHPMHNGYAYFIAISWTFVFLGCQKENSNDFDKHFVDEAKEWFARVVLAEESKMLAKPFLELPRHSPERILARMNKLGKKLNWANVHVNSKMGVEYIVVPLLKDELKLLNNNSLKRVFLFYKMNKKGMQMEVIELLSKNPEIGETIETASSAFENKIFNKGQDIQNEDLQLFFYNKEYNPLAAFKISNKNWTPLPAKCLNKTTAGNLSVRVESTQNENCVLWGTYMTNYDQNGNIVSETLINTYWVCDNGSGPSTDPGESSDPSGGSGSATTTTITPEECIEQSQNAFDQLVEGATVAGETVGFSISDIDALTKNKNPKWKILKGGGPWHLESTELGVVKLIDVSENIWQWESLTHGSISKNGVVIGGEVDVTSHTGTASFIPGTQNILYAGMSVNFTVKFTATPIPCPPFNMVIPPYYQTYTANAIWPAKP